MVINQGDVFWIDLGSPVGSAPGYRHPHVVIQNNLLNRSLLASFDIELMRRLGQEVRDIELGVILGNRTINPRVRWREAFPWLALRRINYQVLCMQVALCFPCLARRVKAEGKRLYVWTANHERQFARMTRLGVDGIVTNFPDRLRAYLAQH